MIPVQPPSHVGDLAWPVMSYLRLDTRDVPAQFVVIADSGDHSPRGRYATVHVTVWPGHVKERYGRYDPSFARAQLSLIEQAGLLPTSTVEVVTVRDPDRSNEHSIFIDGKARPDGTSLLVRVSVHDSDLGASEITSDWVASQLHRAGTLSPAAAGYARDVIAMYADDNDVDVP
ncbi:hypothetical protein WEI85_00595 [Actinomycetes bacterium KLBMP 9797]